MYFLVNVPFPIPINIFDFVQKKNTKNKKVTKYGELQSVEGDLNSRLIYLGTCLISTCIKKLNLIKGVTLSGHMLP